MPPLISRNVFLQGIYPFIGVGLENWVPIHAELTHFVPEGAVNATLYFRGGNSSAELICVVLLCNASPMRLFPIGAKGDCHVPLRVVEDIPAGSMLELHLAAPTGARGLVVVDMGMVEH